MSGSGCPVTVEHLIVRRAAVLAAGDFRVTFVLARLLRSRRAHPQPDSDAGSLANLRSKCIWIDRSIFSIITLATS